MNAILRSSGIKDKLVISVKGDSDELVKSNPVTKLLTPTNQAAKLILLSLLARYD